ncbi:MULTISPECIES: hypothetical protein [Paenibacillus]|uniref:hypothetical protein n=1 Tax=Paenibacillus TaxID=44249 RepID=UPI0022B8C45D|nr:hypothetical protein [Paenibacillus caseinilyticus]MCZ8521801.1 hypothetical protein [Paenibacillus caseinilyticus]
MFFSNIGYVLFAVLLAGASVFTGEVVTFIMLGFIFMSLVTITTYLRKIYEELQKINSADKNS